MPQCPQCSKSFVELPRKCPSCMAELDLLLEYVHQLQGGLEQADRLTRAGELGKAMWAYLAVLEVDPDNPVARRQVGQVATAVRQFDRTAPGRRWLFQIRGEKLPPMEAPSRWRWVWRVLGIVTVLVAFAVGYLLGGNYYGEGEGEAPPANTQPENNSLTGPNNPP